MHDAVAHNQHIHFNFFLQVFEGLQTGVDHSDVHTKQISILCDKSHYTKQTSAKQSVQCGVCGMCGVCGV